MTNTVMATPQSAVDYPVTVRASSRGYDLCIRELLLFVQGVDLGQAYEELMQRKQEIIEAAREIGALDELPPADWEAVLDVTDTRTFGRAIVSRLRRIWGRLF